MDIEDIKTAIVQFVFDFGYVPLDLRVRLNHGSFEIHFSIFKKGSITLADCSRVTIAVSEFMEHFLGTDDFTVDVSSPGADRVLKKPEEYDLFAGKKARIILKTGIEIIGTLNGYRVDRKCVNFVNWPEGEEKEIPFSTIGKCQLMID